MLWNQNCLCESFLSINLVNVRIFNSNQKEISVFFTVNIILLIRSEVCLEIFLMHSCTSIFYLYDVQQFYYWISFINLVKMKARYQNLSFFLCCDSEIQWPLNEDWFDLMYFMQFFMLVCSVKFWWPLFAWLLLFKFE